MAHLAGVFGVIAADAIDAPDRKSCFHTCYGNAGLRQLKQMHVKRLFFPMRRHIKS
jgi:hypothetical protein